MTTRSQGLQIIVVLLFLLLYHHQQLATAADSSYFSFRTPVKIIGRRQLSPSSSTKRVEETRIITKKSKTKNNNNNNNNNTTGEKKEIILIIKPKWARFLYCISALNPFLAVLFNDYSRMVEPFPHLVRTKSNTGGVLTFFTVVRLRPRVSFAIGGLLRALQLTTAFQYVINPPVGVGFGLNVICLFANSRWPATIFLGWSLTGPIWKILGARAPSSSSVPITINFNTQKIKSGSVK